MNISRQVLGVSQIFYRPISYGVDGIHLRKIGTENQVPQNPLVKFSIPFSIQTFFWGGLTAIFRQSSMVRLTHRLDVWMAKCAPLWRGAWHGGGMELSRAEM